MKYSNPKIPDGINHAGSDTVIKDFLGLGAALIIVGGVLFAVALNLGPLIGAFIPFAWEQRLGELTIASLAKEEAPEESARLNTLAKRLIPHMDLPEDMTVTVHVVEQEAVNAFATFGGHIVVFKPLLDAVDGENGLAFVLAHEIAHVKERHVMKRLSTAMLLGLIHAFTIGGDKDLGDLAGSLSNLGLMGFSRGQESESDAEALAAMAALYGHVGGFDQFFKHVLSQHGDNAPWRYFSTHPMTDERIAEGKRLAGERGWPLRAGRPTQ